MKKLFLCSSFKDVAPLLEGFAGDLQGKKVAFIPTASLLEKVVFYVEAGKKALEGLGLVVEALEVSTAEAADIQSKLEAADLIYVSGGNTFYAMQELNKSGAGKCIVKQVEAGKLYIGESAGAMVAAPSVEYAKAMDSVKKAPDLEGFQGLGLTQVSPVPHCSNFPFKKAAEKIVAEYQDSLTLKPINNKEAILICGEDIAVKGV